MQTDIIDTLSHPITRVVGGALPLAADAPLPTMHGLGQTLVSYGGALLASTLIHLIITGITYLKNRKSNVIINQNNPDQTIKIDTAQSK